MTQTVANATAQRTAGPIRVMWDQEDKFRAVLPASVDVKAFLGTASGALYADRKLMEAAANDMDSLVVALMECAALGHLPGTAEYYLTPRGRKGGGLRILGIEGYRGVIERMYRSGAVAKVTVREVCAKDKFRYVDGIDDKPAHFFGGGRNDDTSTGADFFGATGSRDRGLMVGVYGYAELLSGATSRVVILSRDDWEAARAAGGWSPKDEYSPWNRLDAGEDHPEFQGRSMVWKTAVKRLEPWVPTSAEYQRTQMRAASDANRLEPRDQAVLARVNRDAIDGDGDAVEAEIVHDPEPAAIGNGVPAAVPAAQGQLTLIGRQMRKLGFSDAEDAERTAKIAALAGRPDITDVRHLTHDEAQDVLGKLKGCGSRAELDALLEDGEKPGGQET